MQQGGTNSRKLTRLASQGVEHTGALRLCPSARCIRGNLLLGIVQANGSVNLVPEPLEVTAKFVEIANEGRQPESRFRFAGLCQKRACYKWTDTGCGVAQTLVANMNWLDPGDPIPECSIRSHCRWYHEKGLDICRGCQWVITERNDGRREP